MSTDDDAEEFFGGASPQNSEDDRTSESSEVVNEADVSLRPADEGTSRQIPVLQSDHPDAVNMTRALSSRRKGRGKGKGKKEKKRGRKRKKSDDSDPFNAPDVDPDGVTQGKRKKVKSKTMSDEVATPYGNANALYMAGEFAEAQQEIIKAMELDSERKHKEVLITYAAILDALGEVQDKAIIMGLCASTFGNEDPSLWRQAFDANMAAGKLNDALECLEGYFKSVRNDDLELRLVYCELLKDHRDDRLSIQKGMKMVDDVLRRDPKNVAFGLMKAAFLFKEAKVVGQSPDKVVTHLEDMLPEDATDPVNLDVLSALADAYVQCLNHHENIRTFEAILDHHPSIDTADNIHLLSLYAISLIYEGKHEGNTCTKYLGWLSNQAKLYPERVIDVGDAFSGVGEYNLAVEYYRKVFNTKSEGPRLWIKLARCHSDMDETDKALRLYEKIVEDRPDGAHAVVEMSILLRERESYGEAREKINAYIHHMVGEEYDDLNLDDEIHPQVLAEHALLLFRDSRERFMSLTASLIKFEAPRRGRPPKSAVSRAAQDPLDDIGENEEDNEESLFLTTKKAPTPSVQPIDLAFRTRLNDDNVYYELCQCYCIGLMTNGQFDAATELGEQVLLRMPLYAGRIRLILSLIKLQQLTNIEDTSQQEITNMLQQLRVLCNQFSNNNAVWAIFNYCADQTKQYSQQRTYLTKLIRELETSCEEESDRSLAGTFPMLLMAGHCCMMAEKYRLAVIYYKRAYDKNSVIPLVSLFLGLAALRLAGQKPSKKGNDLVIKSEEHLYLAGIAYIIQYYKLSNRSPEASYNTARALHDIGLLTPATKLYEDVLSSTRVDGQDDDVDHRQELQFYAAHNLACIYESSGSRALARQVLLDYAVV